jgi:hypothetical protein
MNGDIEPRSTLASGVAAPKSAAAASAVNIALNLEFMDRTWMHQKDSVLAGIFRSATTCMPEV